MAKELPYFQFEPAEYLTKDISFCSLSAQGLFVNICSYYWQRSCKLTKDQFLRRLNYPNEFQELIDEGVIDCVNGVICIKFLDEQKTNATKTSNKNSINGAKGGRPKKQTETQIKPKLNPTESQTKGIREDKIIQEEIKVQEKVEVEADDTLHDIKILKVHYLNKDRIIKSLIDNKQLGFKNKKHIETRLSEFTQNLSDKGRFSETWIEYTKYFLNWHRASKKAISSEDVNNRTNTIPIG